MHIDEIEHRIALNELNAAQVFTQMKQHIDESRMLSRIYFSIAARRIGCEAVRKERDAVIAKNNIGKP